MNRVPRFDFDRANKMAAKFRAGMTLQEIGNEYSVTRERVRQIISRVGVLKKHGGQSLKTARKKTAAAARRDASYLAKHGCTYAQYSELRLMGRGCRSPVFAYREQKRNAAQRGIEWRFQLWDWWQIWEASGKWDLRGRGEGYCMARFLDTGPYSKENVYICTIGQNFSDSYIAKPWKDRFPNQATKPFSVYQIKNSKKHPYQLHVRGEYVGAFISPDVAAEWGARLSGASV